MEQPVMYLLINNDLKMRKGKCCSQVGHCVGEIVERLVRKAYESKNVPKEYITYLKWKKNSVKIVLKATEEQMRGLMKRDDCVYIFDSGNTQVPPNSLTCIGFYPSSELGELLKDYKL